MRDTIRACGGNPSSVVKNTKANELHEMIAVALISSIFSLIVKVLMRDRKPVGDLFD